MKKITHWTGQFVLRCVFVVLIAQIVIPPALATELTYEQQQAVWKDYTNWNKGVAVSGKAFQELMGSDASKAFLDGYAHSVTVISVSKELVNSGDLAAAARIIKDKLQGMAIEKLTPNFNKWLGWIGWAKAGMELFKDFVFDPMVEGSQIDTYNGLRKAGNEPEDAWAGVRGYGYVIERAKKAFRKQYGDLPFQAGTNELLPAWEANLLRFAKAGMEQKYQAKLHEEVVANFIAAAKEEEAKLPAMRERLQQLLKESEVEKLELDPSESEIYVGEQVVLSAVAVYAVKSSAKSAEDVTGDCTWSGGTYDNVFTASQSDAGNTIIVTAEYAGITGTASITVIDTDCGDNGRWNDAAKKCDCDSGFQWNEALLECIADVDSSEAEEVLRDMEHRFFGAVELFDEHFQNFVAGLQAHATSSSEDICTDQNLAFSFTRAAVAYDLVETYYFEALDLVGQDGTGMNWEAIAGGSESSIHVLDQIRLDLFRKDRLRVQEEGESLPALLAQYAPGCDPEDMLDQGARTAETDQDAETGVDGGTTSGTGGGGGGGGGGGELRFERTTSNRQQDLVATCNGGRMTIEMDTPSFPQTILPNGTYTLSIRFSWSTTGSDVEDTDALLSVLVDQSIVESSRFASFSGSRTVSVTIRGSDFDFNEIAGSITVSFGAGIQCGDDSADGASILIIQPYFRRGSN